MAKEKHPEPLGSSVEIELILKGETASGLALPDNYDYIQERAKVLAVGPDVKDKRIKVGAIVFFKSWALQTCVFKEKGVDKKRDFVEEDKCLAVIPV